jgi:anti-sigma28 factor (negative regulator of flagellin synthesis)
MTDQGSTRGPAVVRKPSGPKATVTDLATVRQARATPSDSDSHPTTTTVGYTEESEQERAGRVAILKAQVAAGTYQIDHYSVADSYTIAKCTGR